MNCSQCGFPLPSNTVGCRHYGFSTAHQESECLANLKQELVVARETNTRLNRRVGRLEAALAEAQKILQIGPGQGGVRWVTGSLGRALLAFELEQRDKVIADLQLAYQEATAERT